MRCHVLLVSLFLTLLVNAAPPPDNDEMMATGSEVTAARVPLTRQQSLSNADLQQRVWREFGEDRLEDLDELDKKKVFLAYAWEDKNPLMDYCVTIARDLRRFGLKTITAIEKNAHESIDSFFEKHVSHKALVENPNRYVLLLFSRQLLKKYTTPVFSGKPEPIVKGEVNAVIQLKRYPEMTSRILFAIIDGHETEAIPAKLMSYPRIDFRDTSCQKKSERGSETYIIGLRRILESLLSPTSESASLSSQKIDSESQELLPKRVDRRDTEGSWQAVTSSKRYIVNNLEPVNMYVETMIPGNETSYLAHLKNKFHDEDSYSYALVGQCQVGKGTLGRVFCKKSYDEKSYDVIWHINFSKEETERNVLTTSYLSLLKKLRLHKEVSDKSLEVLKKCLEQKLEHKKIFLFIQGIRRIGYDKVKAFLLGGINTYKLFSSQDTLPEIPYITLHPMSPVEAESLFNKCADQVAGLSKADLKTLMEGAKKVQFIPGLMAQFSIELKNTLVRQLIHSTSWSQTNSLVVDLEKQIALFEKADVEALIKARQGNREVTDAFAIPEFFKKLEQFYPEGFPKTGPVEE